MESQPGYMKALQILYKALLIGQLLFAAIAILLVSKGIGASAVGIPASALFYVAIGLSVVAVGMSYKLFVQRVEEAKKQPGLTDKLEGYRAAFILQLGLCEGPGLFSIICYFLIGDIRVLILLVLLILNFFSLYPTKRKLVRQLELGSDEESMFE